MKTPHLDKSVISEHLMEVVRQQSIEFKWFITIVYHEKVTCKRTVIRDNWHLQNSLKNWLKRNGYHHHIDIWFSNEIHRIPGTPNHGGYHRHIMMEDPFWGTSDDRNRKRSNLEELIRRLNQSVPNGSKAVDIREIKDVKRIAKEPLEQWIRETEWRGGVRGLIEYLTKDTHRHGEWICDVLDHKNSDFLNRSYLDELYERPSQLSRKTRSTGLLA